MTVKIKRRQPKPTADSFENFVYKVGLGSNNALSQSTYALTNLISRRRDILEAGYRGSWLIGQAIDVVAEDMTKSGITMLSKLEPETIKKIQVALEDYSVWEAFCNTIRWSRLFGGCIAVILIDGAKYEDPLDIDKIGKNSFKGLFVADRWMCEPSMGEVIKEFSKDFGKPKFYRLNPGLVVNATMPKIKIHHTRVLRFDGIPLPYYQRMYENGWGLSHVERIYDRLLSFDSATLGASQLVYKSFLRTIGVKGLRKALALGGAEETAVIKQFTHMKTMQSNEGITLLDSEDQFDIKTNSFGGVADLLKEFGQQISGATGIPLVRLFGQSPSGFNTGETDLRNYYDNIEREQENKLRHPLNIVLEVISKSKLGVRLPEDFEFDFNSLWKIDEDKKALIASSDASSITSLYGAGIIKKETSLKELAQSSTVSGRYTNISQDEIDKAKIEDENKVPEGIEPEEDFPSNSFEETENNEVVENVGEEDNVFEFPEDKKRIVDKIKESIVDKINVIKSKFFTTDKRLRSPEGGVNIKGQFYPGGQFIPSEVDYETARKAIEKKQKQNEAAKQSKSAPESKKEKESKEETKKSTAPQIVKRTKRTTNFSETKRDKDGKLTLVNGKALPEHVAKMPIPPAWTNVIINPDPDGKLLVQGTDKKGRKQSLYNKEYEKQQQEKLKVKINKLNKEYPKISQQFDKDLKTGDLTVKENAFLAKLVANTGARIGSNDEILGEVKAYGLSTLEAKHIKTEGEKVVLDFVGKHGKQNLFEVTDRSLASVLLKLKDKKGNKEKIFDTDYMSFLRYMKGVGDYTPKDFRTKLANEWAAFEIKNMPAPKTPKEYKKAVKEVSIAVSHKLNNTPGMAFKSYIFPEVWDKWKASAGA